MNPYVTDHRVTRFPQESISAHKYVLISRSPVFCAMLTGPARDNSDVISIEDVDRDVFQLLLRCVNQRADLSS